MERCNQFKNKNLYNSLIKVNGKKLLEICLASFRVLFDSVVLGGTNTPCRVVSCARFLTGGVFKCDIAHRWSVAVLSELYKIMCNLMHHLYGALFVVSHP